MIVVFLLLVRWFRFSNATEKRFRSTNDAFTLFSRTFVRAESIPRIGVFKFRYLLTFVR